VDKRRLDIYFFESDFFMQALLSSNLLWTEGSFVVFILIVSALFGLLFYRPLFWTAFIGFIFSIYFFRNPDRVCVPAQTDDSVIVCPADGTVVDIAFDANNGLEGYAQKVSIFLSPLDVHVMWAPMSGEVERIMYRPGTFTFAFLPKSSEFNERNDLLLSNAHGQLLKVRQIAGAFARRICCWVHAGQKLAVGGKYGMIRFGSRVDVFMPSNVSLLVSVGQKVLGGQTVLATWQKNEIAIP
jgi:phosphatidylserine decarboxylase